jgi:hypothetical protein
MSWQSLRATTRADHKLKEAFIKNSILALEGNLQLADINFGKVADYVCSVQKAELPELLNL